ncbi:MAG: hypothetical protein KBA95_18420 [Acidobacteria bacterium]|nr:hypothetical protein [Acidobacteriota bacterium]
MKSRALRVMAVLLAVVALAAGGYLVFEAERQADEARAAQRTLEDDAVRLQAVVADLRAALPGYVASGQDPAYWARRVAALIDDLDARLKRLERPGAGTATAQEVATAREAAATLRQYDARIRSLVEQDRRVEASRLVFSDVNSLVMAASVALSQVVTLQRTGANAALARGRKQQVYALAGAAALALVALLLLVPLPARWAAAPSSPPAPDEAVAPAGLFGGPLVLDSLGRSGFDLDIEGASPAPAASAPLAAPVPDTPALPAPAETPSAAIGPAPAPADAPAGPARQTVPPSALTKPPAELTEVARLCTELAQVADTDQLRQLLGRAAALLHARGIVVWLGGLNAQSLRPAFSHGYSPQALGRMQAIATDEENAVTAAYRTGRLQAVAAGEHGAAALVAPLLAPAGCIGAMAVEVGPDTEEDTGLRAVSELVAAQLATLMPTESQ